jgi:glycosyltransferase involved in cell wall biosynthesis
MNKISVIMPVTLGLYHGCALNRVEKFNRAVNSFINQNYKNKELIIISDGCDIAEDIYVKNFNNYNNILFEKQEKATAFSGSVRNKGISLATGDWICYLDSDDFFGDKHLELLASQITNELDWCFSDDYVISQYTNSENYTATLRESALQGGRIGTSTIIHKTELNVRWSDGYCHDWLFIMELMKLSSKYIHITANYNVCHIHGVHDV